MRKHKNKFDESKPVWLTLYGLLGLGLLLAILLSGVDIALLNPKGLIAAEQHELMLLSTGVLLAIGLPTIFFFYFFAWKYRESNQKAVYDPETRPGKFLIVSAWAIPTVVMVVLGVVMWSATHRLEPRKPIASDKKPLTIQVVSMSWKWLFIYPEQKIATVNFVQIPVDTPIRFELTADASPMSSFWIPHLSGQLYAMTGHVNPLHLMADTPGDYPGRSAEINGAGFAGMKFVARVSTQPVYDAWVQGVRQGPATLDTAEYEKLLKPSQNNPAAFYVLEDSSLYDKVVMKYTGSHEHQTAHTEHTGHE